MAEPLHQYRNIQKSYLISLSLDAFDHRMDSSTKSTFSISKNKNNISDYRHCRQKSTLLTGGDFGDPISTQAAGITSEDDCVNFCLGLTACLAVTWVCHSAFLFIERRK